MTTQAALMSKLNPFQTHNQFLPYTQKDVNKADMRRDSLDADSEPTLNIDQMADNSAYPDDYNQAVSSWLSEIGVQVGNATASATSSTSTEAPSAAATSTQAPPASSSAARSCDLDCGSELPPAGHQPVCTCFCSDGQRWRITNSSPPCE